MSTVPLYKEMANAARLLSVDAIEKAQSGHPGMAMGIADVVTALFVDGLRFNTQDPLWPDRDRLVFSAGHGVAILYSALYLLGYPDVTINELKRFRQLHSKTPGHPEFGHTSGVEATTGPLGQGVANATGMAIAEKIMKERFGKDLVDHKVFVIAGDGCMMEGITHEAASLAGHLGLNNLVIFFDSNAITIDGNTSLAVSEDTLQRFKSYGWQTMSIDGHNFADIFGAIKTARLADLPVFIQCNTIIAKGAHNKEGSHKAHGSHLGADEVDMTRKNLQWPHEPFVVPDEILRAWRDLNSKHTERYDKWSATYKSSANRHEFDCAIGLRQADLSLDAVRTMLLREKKAESTRASSGIIIEHAIQHSPMFIGGSADLTDSNNTRGSSMVAISNGSFAGSYIHYGVREHAMAAIMNGMSLHGGVVPYAGTFLVFSDYMRPAIRLSAIMQRQVIYIMTHDSIGVGEDGPTHQPVEHLASLRAMPNLLVFRPSGAMETADAWEIAMKNSDSPSVLVLTRQNIPFIDRGFGAANMSNKGAYVVADSGGDIDITILATGSEVSLALESYEELVGKHGVSVRVVSMPCWRLFEQQGSEYRQSIIDKLSIKIAVEAGTRFGWDRYIGTGGIFIGVDDVFGLSAKGVDLYNHFGITAANIVKKSLSALSERH